MQYTGGFFCIFNRWLDAGAMQILLMYSTENHQVAQVMNQPGFSWFKIIMNLKFSVETCNNYILGNVFATDCVLCL